MKILLKLMMVYSILVVAIQADCDTCQSGNSVACHSLNRYSLCVNGIPTEDYITCPDNHICTSSLFVCYPAENAIPPSCLITDDEDDNPKIAEFGNQCGVCDKHKVFSCQNETTIAFCFGADEPMEGSISHCPENTVCDINLDSGFCSDVFVAKPSCIPGLIDNPDDIVISSTTTEIPTTSPTTESTTTTMLPTTATETTSTITTMLPTTTTEPTTTMLSTTTMESSSTSTTMSPITTTTTTMLPTTTTEPTTTTTTMLPTTTTVEPTTTQTTSTTTTMLPTITTETTTTTLSTTTMEPNSTSTTMSPIITTTATMLPTTTMEPSSTNTTALPTTTTEATTTTELTTTTTTMLPTSTTMLPTSTTMLPTTTTMLPTTTTEPTTTTTTLLPTTTRPATTSTTTTEPTTTTTMLPTTTTMLPTPSGPRTPNEICLDNAIPGFYSPDDDVTCTKFIVCYGEPIKGTENYCPTGQYFDPVNKFCGANIPDGCPVPSTEIPSTTTISTVQPTTSTISTTTTITTTISTTPTTSSTATTTTPAPAPSAPREPNQICADAGSTGSYKTDDDLTCTKYVLCYAMSGSIHGLLKTCPTGQYFNTEKGVCGTDKPAGCP